MIVCSIFPLLKTIPPPSSNSHPSPNVPEYVLVASIRTQDRWLDFGMPEAETGVKDGFTTLSVRVDVFSSRRLDGEGDAELELIGEIDGV